MAVGVASDSAQGQVTINTATAAINACAGSVCHQKAAAPNAASSTINKKGLATRSASSARRGLSLAARSISATICAYCVALPDCVMRTSTALDRL